MTNYFLFSCQSPHGLSSKCPGFVESFLILWTLTKSPGLLDKKKHHRSSTLLDSVGEVLLRLFIPMQEKVSHILPNCVVSPEVPVELNKFQMFAFILVSKIKCLPNNQLTAR